MLPTPQVVLAASWTTNGPMATGRFSQTATLLQNGMVLVAGGIAGAISNISVPLATPPIITDANVQSNGWFQCGFTNGIGTLFGMLATTNLTLPLSNWTALGGIAEISPGQFQFVDPQATNHTKRFYRLYTP